MREIFIIDDLRSYAYTAYYRGIEPFRLGNQALIV
jgi:hypothetical protein